MDESKVGWLAGRRSRADGFPGVQMVELARAPGAVAAVSLHRPGQTVAEHPHDWPCLSMQLLGSHIEEWDAGSVRIDGPSLGLHGRSLSHANRVGDDGLIAVIVTFDPHRLAMEGIEPPRGSSSYWTSGEASRMAARLARRWLTAAAAPGTLLEETFAVLRQAHRAGPPRPAPRWLSAMRRGLADPKPQDRIADLHPAWVARRYLQQYGEGIRQAVRRRRVERAARALEMTGAPLAEVAVEAGFCDQSHMSRAFNAVLGVTPGGFRAFLNGPGLGKL